MKREMESLATLPGLLALIGCFHQREHPDRKLIGDRSVNIEPIRRLTYSITVILFVVSRQPSHTSSVVLSSLAVGGEHQRGVK